MGIKAKRIQVWDSKIWRDFLEPYKIAIHKAAYELSNFEFSAAENQNASKKTLVISSGHPGIPAFHLPSYLNDKRWNELNENLKKTEIALERAYLFKSTDVPEKFVKEKWSLASMDDMSKDTKTLGGKHFNGSSIKIFLNSVLEGKAHSLVFCGEDSAGDGKTTCACAIIRELSLEHTKKCKFYTWAELCKRLAQCELYNAKETRADVMTEITRNTLIVLDDVARVRSTLVNEVDTFFDVVNVCDQKCVSVIITANMSANDFIKRYGMAAIDRIRGNGTIVEFPAGQSFRGRGGKAA